MANKSWLYLLACAANIAIVLVSVLSQQGNSPFLGKLGYPAYTYLFPFVRMAYRDSSFERSYLFASMCLLLTAIIFIAMGVLNYFSQVRSFLLLLTGVAIIAAYPLGCLWSRWAFFRISSAEVGGFLLEIVLAIVCVILFLQRRWRIPRFINILLVAAHFATWAWIAGSFGQPIDLLFAGGLRQPSSWTAILVAFLLPVLGFISTFIWGSTATFSGNARTGSAMTV